MKAIYYKNSLKTEVLKTVEVESREQAREIFSDLLEAFPCVVYEIE